MIKRNEAAKRAGELGLEWDPEKYEAAKAQPQKYKISAGADKGIAGVTVGSKTGDMHFLNPSFLYHLACDFWNNEKSNEIFC